MASSYSSFNEYLEAQRFRPSTIETKEKIIRTLSNRIENLWDSEKVREYILRSKWKGKRKNLASYAYRDWCRWKGFDYQFKKFREESSGLPYIPLESELDQLIAGCNSHYACFLQLLKESAFRPSEASSLTPLDIDLSRGIVTLNTPLKWSYSRQFKMSRKLMSMITRARAHEKNNGKIADRKKRIDYTRAFS